MEIKIINSSDYAPISIHEIEVWNENYSSFYPTYFFDILKLSIKERLFLLP